ncbi:MAG: hypothetical protein ACOYEV_11745 [Candidatus Nanopelagicales bacterium]
MLRRAQSRGDVWPEVLKLREQLTPWREFLRSCRSNGVSGIEGVEDLLAEMGETPTGLDRIDGYIRQTASVAAAAPLAADWAKVALKSASLIRPFRSAKTVMDAIARPEIRVVRSFAAEARALDGRSSDLQRLFGQPMDRRWLAAAARLNDGGSRSHARLRPTSGIG